MKKIELLKEPVLCYVSEPWAFFTTCPIKEQRGDDWNDAPYEHNAGDPYEWDQRAYDDFGVPKYKIVKIVYDGPFVTPGEDIPNSPYSVDMINRTDIAWLRPYYANATPIHAGATIAEFIKIIQDAGGDVYEMTQRTTGG